MSRTDEELVRDALDHIEILKSHLAKAGVDDAVVADAVNMRIANRLPDLEATLRTALVEGFTEEGNS